MDFILFTFVLGLWGYVHSASVNSDVSKALEIAISKDDFIISMKHIHLVSRRRRTETLFSVEFPGTYQKLSLQLDRENKKVIANFKLNGESESRNFSLNNFKDDKVLKTIMLGVKQSQPHAQLSLYVDCDFYGNIQTVKTLRDIYRNMTNPQILIYHEKKYEIDIQTNIDIDDALLQNGCSSEMQAMQPYTQREPINFSAPQRGDIPQIIGDCETILTKTMEDNKATIRKLTEKAEAQAIEIQKLKSVLQRCNCPWESSVPSG